VAYAPVKTKNRTAIIAALVVGLVAIAGFAVILVLMFSGAKGSDSPEEVVEVYIDAMIDGDVDAMVDLFPEGALAKLAESQGMTESQFKSQLETAVAMIKGMVNKDNFNIGTSSNLSTSEYNDVVSRNASLGYSISDAKKVTMTMSFMGSSQSEDIIVIKIDGKWYLDLDSAI